MIRGGRRTATPPLARVPSRAGAAALVACLALAAPGCFGPEDRRPGFALPGEVAPDVPDDWSFTDAHPEIAIQVRPPWWIPHSVTIWCAAVDGELYVAARNPEEKGWPGWVADDPRVRLGIGDTVYEVRLERLEDEARIARVREAYAEKYDLPPMPPEERPPMRYWRVRPRS